MNPIFAEAYARDGKRFEPDDDGHWNGYAHGLAALAVIPRINDNDPWY